MFRHEEHEQASPRHSTVKISRTKRSSSLDLQSRASSQTTLSPDAQDPLLPHMQSQHVNGRKLSRGKGFLSRKSVKKHSDIPPKSPSSSSERFSSFAAQKNFVDNELLARPRPLFMPHAVSIIPDPLGELPPWYHKEVEYAATSAVQFRTKYPMHDPIGPRWYRNHHLLAPVQEGRPPSMFSSAFPAMVPAPEHTQDPAHMSGPSRTPSGSPLPTPSSSQVRIQEPATKPRSRKTSQTAHDTVDMLDVTDPWGTNWHHESPYDIGANGERNAEPESPISSRPRRRSLTNVSRHRTVNPSPLSQSTSAVHLHTLDSPDAQIPRRLSKRRKPFAGLFGGQNHEGGQTHHKSVLVPTSGTSTYSQTENLHRKPSRAHSTLHSSSLTLQTVHHGAPKEKHSSMLGRLVKRFSVLRRPDTTKVAQNGIGHNWHSDVGPNASNRPSFTGPQAPESAPRASSNSAKGLDPVRRIPPPSVETTSRTSFQEHSRYSASIEEPATAGILTIANPDEPSGSGGTTPVMVEMPLPVIPDKTAVADIEAAAAHEETQVLDMPTSESPVSMHSPVPSPPSEHVDQRTETLIRSVSPPLPNIPESPEASTREVPLSSISEVSSPHTASTERPLPPSPSRTNVQDSTSEIAPSEIAANAPSIPSVDDSALSRLSIIANPPTPYAPPIVIPPPMAVSATNNPVDGSLTKSQRVKASSSTRNRQTETFKLMRSPSGNEHPDGECIVGMGEQWAVVESPVDAPKRSRTREGSRSTEHEGGATRKESRRRDRSSSAEDDGGQSRRHASANGRSTDYSAAASRSTQTPISPERMSSAHTHRDRRGTVGRSGKDGEADVARAPKPSSAHAPSPNPALVHERKPSMSTRPSSEIPSAADSANVKAKDAWEMDRLFKARSMAYGPDGEAIVSTPATIGSNTRPSTFISTDLQRVSSIPSVTALTDLHRTTSMPAPTHTHGSSHTYFVVQTPYQGAQSASYPQIPVPPPPILYSSSPQLAQAASSPAHQQYKTPLDRVPFPSSNPTNDSSLIRAPLANPLPEPPRLSSYQVPPLPPSLAGAGDASASLEYWTQYANVQTTH